VEVSSDSVGSAVAAGGVAVGLPQCVQLRGPRKRVGGSVRIVGSVRSVRRTGRWARIVPLHLPPL
jgi:hypothetical protein